MDLTFEWDENKNQSNMKRRGISFVAATRVFEHHYIERPDPGNHREDRWQVLGLVNEIVLFVVYTVCGEDHYRIISARKAEPHEEKAYYARLARS